MDERPRHRHFIDALLRIDTDDPDIRRRGRTYVTLLSGLCVLDVMAFGLLLIVDLWILTALLSGLLLIMVGALLLTRTGRVDLAGLLGTTSTAAACAAFSLVTGGFDATMLILLLNMLVAGFVLTGRGVLWALVANLVSITTVVLANMDGEVWTSQQGFWALGTILVLCGCAFIALMYARLAEESIRVQEAAARRQRALRRTAIEASKAKSVFLTTMSHELRTPINAIIGYSEMIEEDLAREGADLAMNREDASRIQTAAGHLVALINGVLDIAKIESGKMEVHLEETELDAMLRDVVATCAPLIARNGNTLELDPDLGVVHTDPLQLRQIVFNLLANTVKFTERGVITRRTERHEDHFAIAVEDTGSGIPEDAQTSIFEAFEQADGTLTRVHGGTGLGWSSCTSSRSFWAVRPGFAA